MSEELLSDVGGGGGGDATETQSLYKGLKVSDKPSSVSRVRRNSAGDGDNSERFAGAYGGGGGGSYGSGGDRTPVNEGPSGGETEPRYGLNLAYSTNSESYHDTSQSDRASVTSSRDSHRKDPSLSGRRQDKVGSPANKPNSAANPNPPPPRGGLIRPIPMCYSSENLNLPQLESSTTYPTPPDSGGENGGYRFKTAMAPIRRFSTEADIHHATPLLLEPEPEPELYENQFSQSYLTQPAYHQPGAAYPGGGGGGNLPPYRAPPANPPPAHLYHPRDRLGRGPGGLLPPVDEDEYVGAEEKDQVDRFKENLLF